MTPGQASLIVDRLRLLAAVKAIVEFCDDPNGSEKPESLAMGLARLLPAARMAIQQANDNDFADEDRWQNSTAPGA